MRSENALYDNNLPKKKGFIMVQTGIVKWFNTVKGFGFICPSDGSKDVFVHISSVQKAGIKGLRDGQHIEYELLPGRDGRLSAENLKIAD